MALSGSRTDRYPGITAYMQSLRLKDRHADGGGGQNPYRESGHSALATRHKSTWPRVVSSTARSMGWNHSRKTLIVHAQPGPLGIREDRAELGNIGTPKGSGSE